MSDDEWKRLRESDPTRLLAMIDAGGLSPADLTFAAEQAGEIGIDAAKTLLRLLEHESPLVREGAVYGLSAIMSQLRATLGKIARTDPSKGVREAADEAVPWQC